jgi:hypothetical protein
MGRPREAGDTGTDLDADALGARPYQARPVHRASTSRDPGDRSDADSGVRPYVLTGGRTRSSNALVGFETMVAITGHGRDQLSAQLSERRAILDRSQRPISVVELSAHLRLPLGVAQVLAGDLANEGLICVHEAPAEPSRDRALLERLAMAVQNKQKEVA